jgi:23S rRNA (uracil1939-C5)-methyltransferase
VRKKNKNFSIQGLLVEQMAAEGKALARHEGKVIFMDYAVPGDIVTVQTEKVKKDYVLAKVVSIEKPSELRKNSFCTHFGTCGGCKWQHIPYETQLKFKYQLVEEAFKRIGKFEFPTLEPIAGAPADTYYRNKLEYTFSDRGWLTQVQIDSGESYERRALGFHVPGRFDALVHIDHCYLQENTGNEIRNFIYQLALEKNWSFYNMKMHEGFLRNLILRNNIKGEWMLTLSVAENIETAIHEVMNALKTQFPQITSLNYVVNTKQNETLYDQDIINFSGQPYILEQLGDIQYKIGPKSFFQTNSVQAKHLYDIVKEMACIEKNNLVYDLYTGTGSIALYLADQCQKVVGIETVPEAIEDAHFNATLNGINNTTFIAATVEKILDDEFIGLHGKPDVLITDPPRAGMHERVIEVLLQSGIPRIVYVSCNPATQARDISLLSEHYKVVRAKPVDMFPQTAHIENVVLLERI